MSNATATVPTEGAITKAFLNLTDAKTRKAILGQVATTYGISEAEAKAELTDDGAESLCDYLKEPIRSATHVLLQRHGLVVRR